MAFMDKKEQVLKVEMTPYGRYLYSTGRFKPTHYEFYDDDIIYDKRYAAGGHRQEKFKELQNEVIPRIKRTPTNDLQTVFSTVDDGDLFSSDLALDQIHCKDNIEQSSQMVKASQLLNDSEYSMGLPLGTSENGNKKAPAWEVNLLKGKVSNFDVFLQAPSNRPPNQFRIPQLDVDIDIEVYRHLNSLGNDVVTLLPDMLIAEVDEKNATDGIENEYELEVYYSDMFTLDQSKSLIQFPAPATITIQLSGTYLPFSGIGDLSAVTNLNLYNVYGDQGDLDNLSAGKVKQKFLTLTGSMLTAPVRAAAASTAPLKSSDVGAPTAHYIELRTSEATYERYYVIPNLIGHPPKGTQIDFVKSSDRQSDDRSAQGAGYSEELGGFYFFEGADIIDATRNLALAINTSRKGSQRTFHATSSISFTGTDGSSTWNAITGTVTIETMRVGTEHFGIANPNNAQVVTVGTNGIGVNTDKSGANFSGATNARSSFESYQKNENEKINEVFTNVRRGIPGFIHMGDRENLFTQNLLAYKEQLPFLFDSEDHSVRKYYFSDKPEAEKSDKFINYYFDIKADSNIDRDDFCEARIFDQEKSLYVKGYVDCVKPELQSVDIYDQTDEDFGEPC